MRKTLIGIGIVIVALGALVGIVAANSPSAEVVKLTSTSKRTTRRSRSPRDGWRGGGILRCALALLSYSRYSLSNLMGGLKG